MDRAVYQKLHAALRDHRWQEIVTITSAREDTDPPIHPSIERFDHLKLNIRERLRVNHSTKKNDVAGAEFRRRQGPASNTVAGICGARKNEQSERDEAEHLQPFHHRVVASLDPAPVFTDVAWPTNS